MYLTILTWPKYLESKKYTNATNSRLVGHTDLTRQRTMWALDQTHHWCLLFSWLENSCKRLKI